MAVRHHPHPFPSLPPRLRTCSVRCVSNSMPFCDDELIGLSGGCLIDQTNALVKSDLDGDLAKPSSAIGMIVAALRQRKNSGTPSFTVLSCDNLPENGDKVTKTERDHAKLEPDRATKVCMAFRGRQGKNNLVKTVR